YSGSVALDARLSLLLTRAGPRHASDRRRLLLRGRLASPPPRTLRVRASPPSDRSGRAGDASRPLGQARASSDRVLRARRARAACLVRKPALAVRGGLAFREPRVRLFRFRGLLLDPRVVAERRLVHRVTAPVR